MKYINSYDKINENQAEKLVIKSMYDLYKRKYSDDLEIFLVKFAGSVKKMINTGDLSTESWNDFCETDIHDENIKQALKKMGDVFDFLKDIPETEEDVPEQEVRRERPTVRIKRRVRNDRYTGCGTNSTQSSSC